jgi:hypothetical protein
MNSSMKSVVVYGVLLALSLGGAWAKWTAEPDKDLGTKVMLLDGKVDDIEKIVWTGEKDKAEIEHKSDAQGAYLWVVYTQTKEKVKPHPDHGPTPADPAAAPEPPKAEEPPELVTETQVFKAGENGDKMLETLSPLLAIRKLSDVDTAKLANIGLDAPKESIEITRKGRTLKLELGGESYGTRDRYARDAATGDIYLLDDETIRPLKFARTRLPDRGLFSLGQEKIASGNIEDATGKKVAFEQKNKDDKAKATWVKATAPDAEDVQLKTWIDQALKLKSTAYANPDEAPQNLEPRFKLSFTDEKGKSETLEVLQAGAEGDWWAKGDYTRGLVKLLRGPTSQLSLDVGSLLTE